MIELKDICIEYDRVILDHASISISAHSITLIRGKSGSGKTALLYCIALMDTKSKYQYYYDHHLIEEKDRNNIRKECISCVLQENDFESECHDAIFRGKTETFYRNSACK